MDTDFRGGRAVDDVPVLGDLSSIASDRARRRASAIEVGMYL